VVEVLRANERYAERTWGMSAFTRGSESQYVYRRISFPHWFFQARLQQDFDLVKDCVSAVGEAIFILNDIRYYVCERI